MRFEYIRNKIQVVHKEMTHDGVKSDEAKKFDRWNKIQGHEKVPHVQVVQLCGMFWLDFER